MDDKETQDIISEQMKKLPTDVKDAVFSVDYSAVLDQITRKNRLLIDQAGKLEVETTLVMVGLEPLADYKKNLMKHLGVDEKEANAIIADVNDLIFKKIRASLQKINEEMEMDETLEEQEIQKENVLQGIEDPSKIPLREGTVSISSLASNSGRPTTEKEIFSEGVEINTPIDNNVSAMRQIPPNPRPPLLLTNTLSANPKRQIDDVVAEKMGGATSLPKESIRIEEVSKIPQKTETKPEFKKFDAYREPIE